MAAQYIGRVGALAVALGIGAAVASMSGVAWADGETGTTASTTDTTTTDTTTTTTGTATATTDTTSSTMDTTPPTTGASTIDRAPSSRGGKTSKFDPRPGIVVATGGPHTGTYSGHGRTKSDDSTTTPESSVEESTDPASAADPPPAGASAAGDTPTEPTSTRRSSRFAVTAPTLDPPRQSSDSAPKPDRKTSSDLPTSTVSAQTNSQSTVRRPAVDSTPDQTSSADTVTRSPAREDVSGQTTSVTSQEIPAASRAPEESSAEETPADTVRTVLAAVGLGPLATPGPDSPAEPPGSWIVAAWARREYEQKVKEETPSSPTDPVLTSLALDSTAVEEFSTAEADQQTFAMAATTESNSPPEVLDPFSRPDLATGTVIGTVDATDPDGDPLSYAVTAAPTSGTVTIDAATGAYSYTPNDAARLQAAQTSTRDTDTFIVTVSDGQASTPVTVTLPLSPAQLAWNSSDDNNTATSPTGVATSPDGKYTYVANQGSNTVSVIDAKHQHGRHDHYRRVLLADRGGGQSGRQPEPRQVYVTNQGSNSVSVIDTNTNTVINTIPVGKTPTGMTVSPRRRHGVRHQPHQWHGVGDRRQSRAHHHLLPGRSTRSCRPQPDRGGGQPRRHWRVYVAYVPAAATASVIDTTRRSVNYNKVVKTITVAPRRPRWRSAPTALASTSRITAAARPR